MDSSVEDIVANTVVSSGIALKERLDAMVQLNVLKKTGQKEENKKQVCLCCWPEGSPEEHAYAAEEMGKTGANLAGTIYHLQIGEQECRLEG